MSFHLKSFSFTLKYTSKIDVKIFFSFILQKDYYFQLICKWYAEAVKLVYINIQLLQYHVWNHFKLKCLGTLVENQ